MLRRTDQNFRGFCCENFAGFVERNLRQFLFPLLRQQGLAYLFHCLLQVLLKRNRLQSQFDFLTNQKQRNLRKELTFYNQSIFQQLLQGLWCWLLFFKKSNKNKMRGRNKNIKKSEDSDDDVSEPSVELDTDNSPRFIPIAKLGDKPKTKKIVINISDTQYPIVEQIAEELGWVVQKQAGPGDWDVWWTDRQIDANTFFRMKLHQKINHFPGIYILARKNLFGLGLMNMRQHFPEQYNFFPETWTVPSQFREFRQYYESVQKGKKRTYIVKPEALSQGRGIFLTRNIEDILNGNKYVIQRYIKNPMLIDKLKFDLRIYVLMAGTDPLRLYIYHEGLTRFATEQYREPTNENLNCSYIHLTNYSLNKNNPKYVFNSSDKDMDKGHKRTLTSTYEKLAKNGVDVQALKARIQDAIIKSVISGLPTIRHQYQYCQPEQYEGNMCFHILGFDVMLTDECEPIVIEVNHTPSFETETPLDYLVKKNCIKDTLKLMRITQKNKRKNFERAKQLAKVRLQTGKRDIFKGKERDDLIKKARDLRDQAEKDIMGGYKKIFPPENPELEAKYNKFYQISAKVNRQDCEARKKLLNEEQKKQKDIKSERHKINIKKTVSKQQKPVTQLQLREAKAQVEVKSLKDLASGQAQYDTLQQPPSPVDQAIEEFPAEILQNEVLEQNNSFTKKQLLRSNFRTKVNRKLPGGSNQQLIKYTESIKKFNQLMVKFVVGKQMTPASQCQGYNMQDSQAFQKLKQKIIINKEGKSSSSGGYPQLGRQTKPQVTPGKSTGQPSIPSLQAGGIQCLKIQLRNGSFVRPKNYLISEDRDARTMKVNKKWSADDDNYVGGFVGVDPLISGLVVENRSLKGYSKLLKPGRGVSLRR